MDPYGSIRACSLVDARRPAAVGALAVTVPAPFPAFYVSIFPFPSVAVT